MKSIFFNGDQWTYLAITLLTCVFNPLAIQEFCKQSESFTRYTKACTRKNILEQNMNRADNSSIRDNIGIKGLVV